MTYVLLTNLNTNESQYDPFKWHGPTLPVVYRELDSNWEQYPSGAVLDAEFIRGETAVPQVSEFLGG